VPNELVRGRWGGVDLLIVDHDRVVGDAVRAASVRDRRMTGLSADVIAELVAEIGPQVVLGHLAPARSVECDVDVPMPGPRYMGLVSWPGFRGPASPCNPEAV
jgi:hypothetical protein